MTIPPSNGEPGDLGDFRPLPGSVFAIAIVAFFITVGATSGSLPGALMIVGLAGLVAALYALVTGSWSWARIPSRTVAAIVVVVALATTGIGASLYDVPAYLAGTDKTSSIPAGSAPAPTPPSEIAAFTIEATADPDATAATVEPKSDVVSNSTIVSTRAQALLATIPVKGKAPKTGYDRTAQFGSAWLDIDRNGCDTRNDILNRDLTKVLRAGPCKVLSGHLDGPYTGNQMDFVRGNATSMLVQVDHVVALSNAWQTGAQLLTPAQRISLANDPLNLLAVDGRANSQKGASDAATWLPPLKSFRCEYVSRQVSVKATYGLWVAPAEFATMTSILSDCIGQPAATSGFTPEPASTPAPAPESPASTVVVVNPGSFCKPAGAVGVTQAGTAMLCGTTLNSPSRARWHRM